MEKNKEAEWEKAAQLRTLVEENVQLRAREHEWVRVLTGYRNLAAAFPKVIPRPHSPRLIGGYLNDYVKQLQAELAYLKNNR